MNNKNIALAKNLRKNMTPQERKLWSFLRKNQYNNFSFRRQYPIGNYIVDFICWELMLVIEIDGSQHNQEKDIIYDKKRTEFLKSHGLQVIRFWNNEIDNNIEGVFKTLDIYVEKLKNKQNHSPH